jgi:hypothetical protein
MAIAFESIKAFYADRPERESSMECDYGVHWHDGRIRWPMWRVSYVQATGEIYAVRTGGRPELVKVLGVVAPDEGRYYYRTLDRIFDGWADQAVCRLSWAKARLGDKRREAEARDPRPTVDDARRSVTAGQLDDPQHEDGSWTHPGCPTRSGKHKTGDTAIACAYNTLTGAWKRRRAERDS